MSVEFSRKHGTQQSRSLGQLLLTHQKNTYLYVHVHVHGGIIIEQKLRI